MSADDFNDVDAELLAMAGDDDSDSGSEAGDIPDRNGSNDAPHSPRSPSVEAKPSVEQVEDAAPARPRGVAQKVRKTRGKKKVSKRELEDELLDLGDNDSPSESESVQAGVVDGSDDDADAPGSPEEEGPMYPIDGNFTSEQDRADIMAMPEIERESLLAERAAEVMKKQQDMVLKKAMANSSADASKNKRKAAAAELDDGKKGSKKKSALDNYKKAREMKGTDRASRFDQKSDRKDERSSSPASDRDADGDSEVEYADMSKQEPAADLKDFERCRIGRSNFAKVWCYPDFEKTIEGCFARVSIGVNRETGQNLYRMTQIKGFKDGKPYSLEYHGKTFNIDRYAVVSQGKSEKPWPFHACSDGKFTLEEFQRYHDTLQKEHVKFPKKAALENKVQDIHAFLNPPHWTNDMVNEKMSRIKSMEYRLDPANAAKIKRDAITKRKVEAEQKGDDDEVTKCDAELAALANSELNAGDSMKVPIAPPIEQLTQQEKLAQLNARNRTKTSESVRNALKAERKRELAAREAAAAKEKARLAAEAQAKQAAEDRLLGVPGKKGAAMADLFGDTPDISRAGTPVSGAGTPRRRAGTPMGGARKERGVIGRRKMEEEVMDLGIEVEI